MTADMEKGLAVLKTRMSQVRTGRASASLLDSLRVDYYGTPTPINQVGTVATPEPRLITISPWEKSMLSLIEKAIQAYRNRAPGLKHGIALNRQVTVILSESPGPKPLCGIYFNLHSPYARRIPKTQASQG